MNSPDAATKLDPLLDTPYRRGSLQAAAEYRARREGVSIQNLSFDPQGRVHVLTQGRLRRWWQTKRGWKHYVGEHHGR